MTDLYRMLGIPPHASQNEIKSAYRRLARKYHPDVSSSPNANARFAKISEAYSILSDPAKRAMYDRGETVYTRSASRAHAEEVVAYQREFDRMVDEMMARDRQETAHRSHAVTIIVTLFLSSFYVSFAKPTIIQEMSLIGRMLVILVALYGLRYLVKNLAIVLARYTYHNPYREISVLKVEAPPDKSISRSAGLVFLVSGYIVSLGLGYVLSRVVRLQYGPDLAPGTFLGLVLYPPIAVLIIGSFRKISGFLDRFE